MKSEFSLSPRVYDGKKEILYPHTLISSPPLGNGLGIIIKPT